MRVYILRATKHDPPAHLAQVFHPSTDKLADMSHLVARCQELIGAGFAEVEVVAQRTAHPSQGFYPSKKLMRFTK